VRKAERNQRTIRVIDIKLLLEHLRGNFSICGAAKAIESRGPALTNEPSALQVKLISRNRLRRAGSLSSSLSFSLLVKLPVSVCSFKQVYDNREVR
jgi:hypothetical protein